MTAMSEIEARLAAGGRVVLDGGTGTELERLGAAMADGAWCALATATRPDLLHRVHAEYIAAGADVITANTFANARHMLAAAGAAEQTRDLTLQAVRIARDARDQADRPVVVAGSMSTMLPIPPNKDRFDPALVPGAEQQAANYGEMAGLLAEGGVDLILMEMISDPERARLAVPAAVATGLPVWIGLSCKTDAAGRAVSYHRPALDFREAAAEILAQGGSVAGIMHSEIGDTGAGLAALREVWSGPLMAYPESGYFKMPNWQFVDVIAPAEFARVAGGWVAGGVQVVGGCCGLGVDHIAALAGTLRDEAYGARPR